MPHFYPHKLIGEKTAEQSVVHAEQEPVLDYWILVLIDECVQSVLAVVCAPGR